MTQEPFFTKLQNRGMVKISGTDRRAFLQGLVSNDIVLLDTQACIYACLLTPNGKFLHDFFVTEEGDTLLLDCEGDTRTQDLARRLDVYKLRANIEITVEPSVAVYAGFGAENAGHPDPRHPDMGLRCFIKPDLPEKPFPAWDAHRIRLGVPDGSRDMVPESSTLLECNIDKFHGVSFDKGCYMGQELTARMHYRGLAKKHLYTVTADMLDLTALPAPFTPLEKEGHMIGEMRSSCGNIGLALMKDSFAVL